VPPTRPRRRWHGWSVLGVVLLVVGSLTTLISLVPGDGICRFVPCDPAVPGVAFAAEPDGAVRVEFGDDAADEVTEIFLVSGPDPSWRSPTLWRAERTGVVPDGWSGTVVLGTTPEGFTETVPLTGDLTDATAFGIGNGCYGTIAEIPADPLPTDGVLTEWGETLSLDAFRAEQSGLTPCTDTSSPSPWPPALATAALGLAIVLVVARLRARDARRAPAR